MILMRAEDVSIVKLSSSEVSYTMEWLFHQPHELSDTMESGSVRTILAGYSHRTRSAVLTSQYHLIWCMSESVEKFPSPFYACTVAFNTFFRALAVVQTCKSASGNTGCCRCATGDVT